MISTLSQGFMKSGHFPIFPVVVTPALPPWCLRVVWAEIMDGPATTHNRITEQTALPSKLRFPFMGEEIWTKSRGKYRSRNKRRRKNQIDKFILAGHLPERRPEDRLLSRDRMPGHERSSFQEISRSREKISDSGGLHREERSTYYQENSYGGERMEGVDQPLPEVQVTEQSLHLTAYVLTFSCSNPCFSSQLYFYSSSCGLFFLLVLILFLTLLVVLLLKMPGFSSYSRLEIVWWSVAPNTGCFATLDLLTFRYRSSCSALIMVLIPVLISSHS